MNEAFVAPIPKQSDLPAHYLARLHPVYCFRTYRCQKCGREQYDAGQNACLFCGAFWSLRLVWPEEE